jgi:hypothetical protein
MASPKGRGAQVRLDGDAQAAARGALGLPLIATQEAKRVLEYDGVASDGATPDGATRAGIAAEDEVLAPAGVPVATAGPTVVFGTVAGTAAEGNDPRIVGAMQAATAAATFATPATAQTYTQAVVGLAPATLNTLQRLAAALQNDPNLAVTLTNTLAARATRIATLEGQVAALQAGGGGTAPSGDTTVTLKAVSPMAARGTLQGGLKGIGRVQSPSALAVHGALQAVLSGTLVTQPGPAQILVGPTRTLTTIAAGIAAAAPGDTIAVDAGTYTNDYANIDKDLTLRGVGGMVYVQVTNQPSNGQAAFKVRTANATFENFRISGVTVPDANGAPIRPDYLATPGGAVNLTLKHCFFHNNQNNLLGNTGAGEWLIEDCEFANGGIGDGFSHNVYISGAKVTMRRSFSHDSNVGHLFKSNCAVSVIENCRLLDLNGDVSYCADFPRGGVVSISDSVIEQGAVGSNGTILSYARELATAGTHPSNSFTATNCVFVNDRSAGGTILTQDHPTVVPQFINCTRWPSVTLSSGSGAAISGTVTVLGSRPTLDTSTLFPSAPVVTSANFSLNESANIGAILGAVTAANAPTSWAITAGNTGNAFAISSAGVITLAASLDYDTLASYSLTVAATNTAGTGIAVIGVTVFPQSIPVVASNLSFTADEAAANGAAIGTVTATNNPTAWAITAGNTGGAFAISSAGVITKAGTLNAATLNAYTLTVSATNKGGTTTGTVGITVATFTPQSLFASSVVPGTVDSGDGDPYTLGLRFKARVAGKITAVRYYKSAANTGTHTVYVWNAAGTVVASKVASGETATGWQTITLDAPVTVNKNTNYTVGYFVPNGHYSVDTSYYASAIQTGDITVSAGNCYFNASSSPGYPSSTFNASNYWIDLVFVPTEVFVAPPEPVIPGDASIVNFDDIAVATGATIPAPANSGFTFTQAGVYNNQVSQGFGWVPKSGTKILVWPEADLTEAGTDYPARAGSPMRIRRTDNGKWAFYGAWFSANPDAGLVFITALRDGVVLASFALNALSNETTYADLTGVSAFNNLDEVQIQSSVAFALDNLTWASRTANLVTVRPATSADAGLVAPAVLQPTGGADIVGFNLSNQTGATAAAQVVRFNQQFAPTDLPAGQYLTATVGGVSRSIQMDVEQRHPDGSVKSALITQIQPSLAAGASVQGILQRTTTAPATALPLNQAIVNGYDLVVSMTIGGTVYNVDAAAELASAISGSTYTQYRRGPHAVELRVDRYVVNAFRLSLVITAHADGSTATQVQFNNDLAMEPTGGAISVTNITVTQAGQTKYSNTTAFTQQQYQKWFKLVSNGAGAAASLLVIHDISYRQQIGVLQPIDLKRPMPQRVTDNQNAILADATATRDVLPVGGLFQYMPSTGGRPDIGIHTEPEASWMVDQSQRAFNMMALWARVGGSPPLHMYERASGTYSNTDSHPRAWVTVDNNGNFRPDGFTQNDFAGIYAASGWTPESAHVPEASYVHYMATGDHFSLDVMIGFASWSMLNAWYAPRQDGLCLFANGDEQSRAQAWMMRQVLNVVDAAPDSDPNKLYYSRVASRNFAYHAMQAPGWAEFDRHAAGYLHAVTGDGTLIGQVSMDYWASQTTRAVRHGEAQALTVLRHNAKFNINRFGYVVGNADLDPISGFAYLYKFRAADGGQPYATWAEAQLANYGAPYTLGRALPANYFKTTQFFPILTGMGSVVSFNALCGSKEPADHLLACDYAKIRGWLEWAQAPEMYDEPQHIAAFRMPDGSMVSTVEFHVAAATGSGHAYSYGTANVLIYDYGDGGNTLTAGSKGSILIDHSANGGDTLIGGAGSDYLIGTNGTCRFRPGAGANVVRCSDGVSTVEADPALTSSIEVHRFKAGFDRIDLTGTADGTGSTVLAGAVVSGGNTTLTVGGTTVILVGVTSGLTTANFV